jgi:sigma-B regulation protein RsbU (phosphoserine phosphatase)
MPNRRRIAPVIMVKVPDIMDSSTTQPDTRFMPVDPFLLEVADVVNTTLDLDALLRRVAELVRRVIDYEIFAILLLNEKSQELRIRFQVGHPPEVAERYRIKVGQGITGLAAQRGEALLVSDVLGDSNYIGCMPEVRSELAVPLIVKNKVIGVIDIEAPQPNYFTAEHKRLLSLVASRVAIGIENARLYTRVARQARTLEVLNGISRELTSILHLDALLQRIAELLTRLIDYQMFGVLLLDPSGQKLQHRFSLRFKETVHIKDEIPLGEGLVGYSALHKEPVLVRDVSQDPRYLMLNPETRAELVVPLIYQDKVIGVLDIEHTRRGYFTDFHVHTLSTLAGQVAIAIENARLYERVEKQERRLQKDLALARELQFRLLPACCPTLGHAQVAARFQPARAIGGDLYDFLPYRPDFATGQDGRVGIAIGDVSGKGAPAALYAALASGILRAHAAEQPGAAEMLARMNASLGERAVEGQFLTMIYALWREDQRTLHIANSGLPRPIYCHQGKLQLVEAVGLPLGLFERVEYEEIAYPAHPGDLFVFFSDGIMDMQNSEGEFFGRHRVEEVVQRVCHGPAQEVVNAIFQAARDFAAGEQPYDDQTVVVLRVLDSTPYGKR